jgi:predicted dehydrogenase
MLGSKIGAQSSQKLIVSLIVPMESIMPEVLIVGGGSIGERHLRCFSQIEGCRVALCEIDHARRSALVEQYHPLASFPSLDQAAARSWDAAVICTPAHLHVAHALKLNPVTAAFLIEKPLATRLDDTQALKLIAQEKPLAVAYVLRVHPAVEAVRAELAAGRIGQLLEVVGVSGQHFPTFRPAYREIYYKDLATGGGAIQDAATHMFNLVQHVAGRFAWIACDYEHLALEGVEVEDTVHLIGRTEAGIMASVSLNQFMAPNELIVNLNGREGSLQLRLHEQRWGVFRHGDAAWQYSPALVSERDDLFRRQAAKFLDVCRGKAQPACNLAEAQDTLAVNLAALKSRGEKISIDQRK